jgi:hypothetical protein
MTAYRPIGHTAGTAFCAAVAINAALSAALLVSGNYWIAFAFYAAVSLCILHSTPFFKR